MNKKLNIFITIAIFFVILCPIKTSALEKEYGINKYDIDIVVNEDNTYDITENIDAYFYVNKHGIYRNIPIKNTVSRLDGTVSTNRAKVSDLNVNDKYSKSISNNDLVIKIGDANRTYTGSKHYTLKYKYNIGKDKSKDYDEFYYNIIGNGWDTDIKNISFKITMPSKFDESKLGFSSGEYGSINNNVSYKVNGNVITGTYNNTLYEGEALTVRLELKNDYFNYSINYFEYIYYFIPILFVIIIFIFWFLFGRDTKTIDVVEYMPPENLNSLEVGFIYNGKAGSEDVTSLLIYLANKGYLKIVEKENKGIFSRGKDFKIVKLKDYNENNEMEKMFFNGLFKNKNNSSSEKEIYVTKSDLYDSFYKVENKILSFINTSENKNKIFKKGNSIINIFCILSLIITFLLITIKPILEYGTTDELPFAIIFPGFGFLAIMFSLYTLFTTKKIDQTKIFLIVFFLVWGFGFGGIPWLVMVLPILLQNSLYLIGYLIGIICIGLTMLFIKIMPKKTEYGTEMYSKIKGFKLFLENVEKEKLEELVIENPEYFYEILPFTYVLGISDKWIKKFETISLKSPNWYDGYNSFDTNSFGTFISSTLRSANTAMSSSPSSGSSGGGFSGGGSSGGGSGGGGGGSW